MDQGQQFKIASVICNKVTHQGNEIIALCLRTGCDQASAQCFKCVQELHQGCQDSMKMCKDVPQMVIPLQSMRSKLLELKLNMNLKMDKLIKLIEETLIPIIQYSENPNLSNINKLGIFLKIEIEAKTIKELEKFEEEIKSLFQQCKNNLFKKSPHEIEYEALEQKIQQLIKKGKQNEALKIVEATLSKNQNDKRLLLNKGLILYELCQFQKAMNCYDLAIQIDSVYKQAWHNKGMSLWQLDKNEEAIICFNQAIKIDPNYIDSWNNKGFSLNELKRYQEAIICFDQAIKIDPNYVDSWNNKGCSLNELKSNQEAIICFDQVIKIDPNYVKAWNNKGYSLNELKRYQEAIICFDQAIKIDPNFPYCHKNKGYSLIGLKLNKQAITCFGKAIQLQPDYEEAITGLKIAEEELKKLKK